MELDTANLEESLRALLYQLKTESQLLDRLVYKSRNQHRHGLYFQHLSKVRRDLKLVESAGLEDVLCHLFYIIDGRRLTEMFSESYCRHKRSKHNRKEHNFHERLLGAARLLSQVVEPIARAAIEISPLLARSFFVGFCLTVLAILARLRILVQQILLHIVRLYNQFSALLQQQHSMKLANGIEVFGDNLLPIAKIKTLECKWEDDKYSLYERTSEDNQTFGSKGEVRDVESQSGIKYDCVSVHLESPDGEMHASPSLSKSVNPRSEEAQALQDVSRDCSPSGGLIKSMSTKGLAGNKRVHEDWKFQDYDGPVLTPSLKPCSDATRVAFVPVKKPATGEDVLPMQEKCKQLSNNADDDSIFNLFEGIIDGSVL